VHQLGDFSDLGDLGDFFDLNNLCDFFDLNDLDDFFAGAGAAFAKNAGGYIIPSMIAAFKNFIFIRLFSFCKIFFYERIIRCRF